MSGVVACIDETLRAFGGVPTYGLSDIEKTVTTERVAGIAVRHPDIVHDVSLRDGDPHVPQSGPGIQGRFGGDGKGSPRADVLPTTANLLEAHDSFTDLEVACQEAMDRLNARGHRETRCRPDEAISDERLRLHPVPASAHTLAFGKDRTVDRDAAIRYGSARYSVPHTLIGEKVWARVCGDELVVVDAVPTGAREVARHKLTTPGNPRIVD